MNEPWVAPARPKIRWTNPPTFSNIQHPIVTNLNKFGELEEESGVCPECTHPVEAGWKRCPQCGFTLESNGGSTTTRLDVYGQLVDADDAPPAIRPFETLAAWRRATTENPGPLRQTPLPKDRPGLLQDVVLNGPVKGAVFGETVNVKDGVTVDGDIVARVSVSIAKESAVKGSVVAGGKALVHGKVNGDLWSPEVGLSSQSGVGGRVFCQKNIVLSRGCVVGRALATKGNVTLEDGCTIANVFCQILEAKGTPALDLVCATQSILMQGAAKFKFLYASGDVVFQGKADGEKVFSRSSVKLPGGSSVGTVCGLGDVTIGDGCHIKIVSGKHVRIGENCHIGSVHATNGLAVGKGTQLGRMHCPGSVALAESVSVKSSHICSLDGKIRFEKDLKLGGRTVSDANRFFITRGGKVVLDDKAGSGTLLSTWMDRDLYRVLSESFAAMLTLPHLRKQ